MKTKILRLRAIVPLLFILGLMAVFWLLLLDTLVERSIEILGAELVGAKVDVASADVRLRDGSVEITGLQVTNPDAPMKNLFEIGEIEADIRTLALTEKKVFIDTIAIRGVRFGTDRETSGALSEPSVTNAAIRRSIDAWADRVQLPEFSLAGLGGVVNVAGIRPESLQTLEAANRISGEADSLKSRWEGQIGALDPRPTIDSAQALAVRLQDMSFSPLNVGPIVASVQTARGVVEDLNGLEESVAALDDSVRTGVEWIVGQADRLDDARTADLARARGLMQIPSLDAPDLSPALFGAFALDRIRPILYWLGIAEQYMPPGLDPRRRPGPERPRRAGETIDFPKFGGYPAFTIDHGEASLLIDREDGAGGEYVAQISGLTSSPSVLGRPMRLAAQRSEGAAGPTQISLAALLDHVGNVSRDSVAVGMAGISLPSIDLPGLGAALDLGNGVSELSLQRDGEGIAGRWLWRSSNVSWDRLSEGTGSTVGDRVQNLVWETVSALEDVEIEVRISGNTSGPSVAVRSNIATAIASGLRDQLHGEIDAAERQLRAEVDRLVAQPMDEARAKVAALQTDVLGLLDEQLAEVEVVKAELEAEIRRLTRFIGARK